MRSTSQCTPHALTPEGNSSLWQWGTASVLPPGSWGREGEKDGGREAERQGGRERGREDEHFSRTEKDTRQLCRRNSTFEARGNSSTFCHPRVNEGS